MELDQILNSRRTHRLFSDQKVGHELIEQLIEAAVKAPVSCNLQIAKFIFIDDNLVLDKLAQAAGNKFKYSPCILVILNDSRYTIKRHSGLFSTAMATENIVLKATELGLATCPMAGFEHDREIKKILSIPAYFDVALIMAIGYADRSELLHSVTKIPISQLYSFNSFRGLSSINPSSKLKEQSVEDIIDYRQRIAPVYLDRFRLNTWAEKYYTEVADFFAKNIFKPEIHQKILDILSYDGQFVKALLTKHNLKSDRLITSDYLDNNLDFFKETFQCPITKISSENKFVDLPDNNLDLATMIFQIEFTPQPERLLADLSLKLKIHGQLFIVLPQVSIWKKFLADLNLIIKRIIHKQIDNVYENNPFYKIGPREIFDHQKIKKLCQQYNFTLVKKDTIKKYPQRGIDLVYYLFKKN